MDPSNRPMGSLSGGILGPVDLFFLRDSRRAKLPLDDYNGKNFSIPQFASVSCQPLLRQIVLSEVKYAMFAAPTVTI